MDRGQFYGLVVAKYLTASNRKNGGISGEIFDEIFFGCSKECLRLTFQKLQELSDPTVVQLSVNIVEEEKRIFTDSSVVDRDVCQEQDKNRAPLLTGRAKLSQLPPVEVDLKIVTMRADQSMPRDDFRLNAKFETQSDIG